MKIFRFTSSPFTEVAPEGDAKLVHRQLGFVIGGIAIRFFCFLIGSLVLTSLIPAAEFGLLVYISVPLSLANLFGDFGLGDGAIRLKRADPRTASLFLWVNLSLAIGSAGLFVASIPLFELWFEGAELMDLALAFAANIVVLGISGQYRALLRRQMRLKLLSATEVATSVVTNGVSVALAMLGLGVIAIPLGRLASLVLELLIFVAATGWVPGRVAKLVGE